MSSERERSVSCSRLHFEMAVTVGFGGRALEAPEGDRPAGRSRPTSPNVTALAKKLSERQERLNELDARIRVLKTAPNVVELELRRLEVATRERLTKLHETMRGNIQEARQALQSVLESPLTMTPREDSTGREYAITGRLVLGDALALGGPAPSPDQTRGLRVADYSRPRREPHGGTHDLGVVTAALELVA
jgi:hypothetical protein